MPDGGITITVEENGAPIKAFGGGLEGAQYTSRETARWSPSFLNPDSVINLVKQTADARGRDSAQNDGYGMGAVTVSKDSIVGAQFRLNSNPATDMIPGADEGWQDEFQKTVELRWGLAANSNDAWLDAARINTFTGMCRLAVAGWVLTGEVCASAEWIRQRARPFKTAIQMFSPDRLSNPNGMSDTFYLRRGIARNDYGQPVAYSVRNGDQYALYPSPNNYTWTTFAPRTPWGRKQMIHIIEQLLPDQSRGVSDMVSVLKQMRMTKKFQDITLQNAVINASYAAAVESELPDVLVQQAMGTSAAAPGELLGQFIAQYLGGVGEWMNGSNNLMLDGSKIPHLYPGTKLNMKPMGTPGGVGTGFESSLLRHICAGLGLSYEEFSKDYSQVSYSSARASIANTEKTTKAKKKFVADRFADDVFQLWFEEDWNAGNLPVPKGQRRNIFYLPLMKEALTRAKWISSGAGQIDELKETQASILKIQAGLSTWEIECARQGEDYREVFKQAAREQAELAKLNITFNLSAKRPLGQPAPVTSEDTGPGSATEDDSAVNDGGVK